MEIKLKHPTKHFFTAIIGSGLGNFLEWYDFGLFTIFSAIFSKLFFPTTHTATALLAIFSIFAVGFICRPLGALFFGYLGDKKGRANTVRLSILMTSLPTLLIAFIPTYAQAGYLAPLLLIFIRMWQGMSIGGGHSGNLIYLAEISPPRYRATFTSLASTGANAGILLAAFIGMLTTYYCSTEFLYTWGWRIPYLLSGVFSLLLYQYRIRIPETPIFTQLKTDKKLAQNPIHMVFFHHTPHLLRTIGLVCVGSTFYYFCFIYLPVFLTQELHYSLSFISTLIFLFIATMLLLVPLSGYLCDRIGRRKLLLLNASLIACLIIPSFYLLQLGYASLLPCIFLLFTLLSSLEQATTSIAVVENFPASTRYTGIGLGYNLGNGFLGGMVPIICTSLISFILLDAWVVEAGEREEESSFKWIPRVSGI